MVDEPAREMPPITKAAPLIQHLEASGKPEVATKLRETVNGPVDGLLFALRELCNTLFTAVESLDPATETMFEELRTEVESHLRRHEP